MNVTIAAPKCASNDVSKAGKLASRKVLFGEASRFAVFAIHSRFGAIHWMVTDAERIDPLTETPEIIRQGDTFEEVMGGFFA